MNESRNAAVIPEALRALHVWAKTAAGRKAPIGRQGPKGWKEPANWFSFDEVKEGESGVVLDGLLCLDFDHVLHTPCELGSMSDDARALLDEVTRLAGETYMEASASGTGLHVLFLAQDIPPTWKSKNDIGLAGKGEHVDILCKRFFVKLTGHTLGEGRTLATAPPALLAYLTKRMGKDSEGKTSTPPPRTPAATAGLSAPRRKGCKVLTAEEVPDKLRASKSGPLFQQLFDIGDITGPAKDYTAGGTTGESEADEALFLLLAPYCGETGGDAGMMEEVFKKSRRYALVCSRSTKKGHEEDYIHRSIKAALEHWDGWYYGKPRPGDPVEIAFPVWDTSGKSPRVLASHWQNTKALLDTFGISCRYNIMTKDIEIRGTAGGDTLDCMSGDAIIPALHSLAHANGLRITKKDLADNLLLLAEKNRYSPVRDFLQACLQAYKVMSEIDDMPNYIGIMFERFELNPDFEQDRKLDRTFFEKWLIGTARIAFNEGKDTMQGVLILQGPQGIGKSRFLFDLVPDGADAWVLGESSIDPADKDSRLQATKYWIVEASEMNETMKKDKQDALKQFFTARADEIRVPYGRKSEKRPRITAYYGTTNDVGILKDMTGNRRYWILPVLAIAPLPDTFDLTLFWGQVMYKAFELKEPSYLTKEEVAKLALQNQSFESLSDEEQAILDTLDWDAPTQRWTWRTSTVVGRECGIHGRVRMVGKALRHIAGKDKRVKPPTNNHGRRYLLPPVLFEGSEYLE